MLNGTVEVQSFAKSFHKLQPPLCNNGTSNLLSLQSEHLNHVSTLVLPSNLSSRVVNRSRSGSLSSSPRFHFQHHGLLPLFKHVARLVMAEKHLLWQLFYIVRLNQRLGFRQMNYLQCFRCQKTFLYDQIEALRAVTCSRFVESRDFQESMQTI